MSDSEVEVITQRPARPRSYRWGFVGSVQPTAEDKAQAAGLVEGEGSILLFKTPRGKAARQCIYARVTVANTELELLRWLRDRWGGFISPKPQRGSLAKRPCYAWSVTGTAVAQLLDDITPRLLGIKRRRAQKALELIAARREGPQGGALPPEQHELYQRIYEAFRAIGRAA